MGVFNLYLIKRSFVFSISILILFGILDSIFSLISELENISERYTFISILVYVFQSMPHRLIDFVEGACLLGVMIALAISHQEGNLNVLRSAGKSPFKIIIISSIGPILLATLLILFDEVIFKKSYINAEINKNVLLEKVIASNENKWINQNDLFLGYQDIIEDNIFNAKLIKLIDDKEINVFESKLAKIDDTKIVFDDDQQVNFVIPIQSRISIKNIQNENISELYYLKKLFIESKLEDDILFKQHIDKALYKVVLIPLSIFALIAYFGSLIFGSLRDLNIGARITIAVFGAFVYKLMQDLSIGIFISFNLSVLIGVMIPSILLALLAINSYRKI